MSHSLETGRITPTAGHDEDSEKSGSETPLDGKNSIDPSSTLATISKLPGRPMAIDSTDEESDTSPHVDHLLDRSEIPWHKGLIAFSMIIFFSTGSSYCEGTLSPLKSTLLKKLGINSKTLCFKSCTDNTDDRSRCAVRRDI